MGRQYERYVYLAAGTLIMLFVGLIYAWSIFRAPFSEIFPSWTVPDLSRTFTISIIFFCLGGFTSGRLTLILKSRTIVHIAALLLAGGFFLVSRLDPLQPEQSLRKLYIFYGVFCGLGVGMGYNSVISAIIKWFPDKPGTASGALLMAFGFGGLVLGSLVNVLINENGLFLTFFILAIAALIVLFLCSFLVRAPQAPPAAAVSEAPLKREYAPLQMIRTPLFWIWFVWNIILSSAGLLAINSAAAITAFYGAPAVLGLLVSVSNGAGRFLFGGLVDKFGRRKVMNASCTIMLASGICLYTGAVLHNILFIVSGLLFIGLTYGSSPSISSVNINSFFGPKNFPVNFSIHNFLLIPSAIAGPTISSIMQERSGGEYYSTFILIITMALAAFIISEISNRAANSLLNKRPHP